jgi:hypothetical protein
VPAPPPTGPPAPAPVQEWSVALPAATRAPLRHRAAPGAPGRAGPAPVHDRSPDPAPPAEPGDSDSGFSVGLPYGPAVATPAAAGPLTGPGAPDLSGPPGGPPRSGPAREAPAPDDGPDQRRRPLTALALGQVCCLLALQTRYLLHRAVSHRLGRGARRTAHRCPSCRAHLAHVA